ncbi:NfeD family protein [Microbacterium sp. PAMC21962]|uniref:NfeD family protein n=1 Tax=Microbacterium sp. PAMC21962 TaxID=2861280 RepID=UPI001C63852B|nr:NfeD family protein [Microbacterium sp. PAMC21962]QYF97980.1 NfeD family protein [Microbacterium sp. PAMC21962]
MLPDLTQYLWIAWLVLAVIFVIIELLTLEFTFLMLAAGSLIGGLGVNLLGGPWWLQVLIAAAVSALLLFTIRPLLLRALHRSSQPHPTNVDALYGMGARVSAAFVDGGGYVRLDNGEQWTAELAPSAAPLGPGDRAVVTAVRGATVEVAPAAPLPAPGSPAASDSPERSTD